MGLVTPRRSHEGYPAGLVGPIVGHLLRAMETHMSKTQHMTSMIKIINEESKVIQKDVYDNEISFG